MGLSSLGALAVRSSADAVMTGTHRLALFASNPCTSGSEAASSTNAPRESSFADILSSSLAMSTWRNMSTNATSKCDFAQYHRLLNVIVIVIVQSWIYSILKDRLAASDLMSWNPIDLGFEKIAQRQHTSVIWLVEVEGVLRVSDCRAAIFAFNSVSSTPLLASTCACQLHAQIQKSTHTQQKLQP